MVWNDTRWPPRQPRDSAPPDGPVLDMTPDGQFIDSRPAAPLPPAGARVLGIALIIAVLAGALAIALLALWVAVQLIPIAIGAGLIAYGAFRFQAWRAGRSLGRNGNWLRR